MKFILSGIERAAEVSSFIHFAHIRIQIKMSFWHVCETKRKKVEFVSIKEILLLDLEDEVQVGAKFISCVKLWKARARSKAL